MKTALVTGSSKRVGQQIVRELHNNGFNVIVHTRNSQEQANDLITELNDIRKNSAHYLIADLAKLNDIKKLAKETINITAKLDVLVNNASSFSPTLIGETTETQWNNLMNSNLFAPFFLSQELKENITNCIINIIDIHANKPLKDYPVYSTAKAGLKMLTKAMAKELAPNIRVNGISPGAILWPQQDCDISGKTQKNILNKIALKKQGSPKDIAQAVFFLTQAKYITGQILAVDGGRSLNQ